MPANPEASLVTPNPAAAWLRGVNIAADATRPWINASAQVGGIMVAHTMAQVDRVDTFHRLVAGLPVQPAKLDGMLRDDFHRPEVGRRIRDKIQDRLPDTNGRRPRVVDVAGGTALNARELAPHFDVTVVDADHENVLFVKGAEIEGVDAVQGDMNAKEGLPVPDGSMDAATIVMALRFGDGDQVLRNMHRAVREDGGLIVIPAFRTEEPLRAFTGRPNQPVLPDQVAEQAQRAGFDVTVEDRVSAAEEWGALAWQGRTVPAGMVVGVRNG